jgi:tetrahydromethanopterin S-methyltransferase subunit C
MNERNGNGRRSPIGMARLLGFGVRALVHKDVEMAREEIASKAKRVGIGAGMFGAAGVVGLVALGALTAAAILGLAIVVPAWAAALIVGVVWAVVAAIIGLIGKRNLAAGSPPVPSDTARTVKDDVRALAGELKRGK